MLAVGAVCQAILMKNRLNVNSMDELKGKAMQDGDEKPTKNEEDMEALELIKSPDPPADVVV